MIALVATSLICSCGGSEKPYEPHQERKYFTFPARQLAPEPVYNRLTLVRPPDPLPDSDLQESDAPVIHPVIHLDIKDASLEQAARVLASAARYNAYCSSLIADRTITMSELGTIDELAKRISRKANIEVVVDHQNAEVRFLANKVVSPALFEEGEEKDEHQQVN
jgi:hypothetical protein